MKAFGSAFQELANKNGKPGVTYISFADDDKCRGVVLIDGLHDVMAAHLICGPFGLDVNPGGEMIAFPIPEGMPNAKEYAAYRENMNRLLAPEEARELFGAKSIREHEEEEARS